MKLLSTYKNGNTHVSIYSDGTKVRTFEGVPQVEFPESIDVKITNYCDMGCTYCHENSTIQGLHGDLGELLEVLSVLPAGVELAIGGGNPLSHPGLVPFLQELKKRGIVANITVNQGHLLVYQEMLKMLLAEELVHGLGISVTSNNFKYVKPLMKLTDNIVFHVIAGVNDIKVIGELIQLGGHCKVLILGYKMFGRGLIHFNPVVTRGIESWRKGLRKYIKKCTISFDNLAIEQLEVKKLLTKEAWGKFYMGDDFQFTMYIDAVEKQFAPTSRTLQEERVAFSESTLLNYFKSPLTPTKG